LTILLAGFFVTMDILPIVMRVVVVVMSVMRPAARFVQAAGMQAAGVYSATAGV
jgi:hypothetical protein